jgi:tetratricopeptide (TPR) repeat protein
VPRQGLKSPKPETPSGGRRVAWLSLLLFLGTFALFARTASHGFIAYDDPGYVTGNRTVQEGLTWGGAAWAFGSTAMSNWHPATWLSHMLDVQLFGLAPAGHHLVSVGLHASSAVVLFLFLLLTTGATWRSLAVAGLFAIHPMHVESVAWVAERKDVLSGLFWHLTLLLYAMYVRDRRPWRYVLALLAFGVGLLAKPMLVTLPVVLLLLDWWPLGRFQQSDADEVEIPPTPPWRRLLWEKAPFALLSIGSSAITIAAQHRGGSMAELELTPLTLRVANALTAYVRYVGALFWPHDLAVLYPLPGHIPAWEVVGAAAILAILTLGAVVLAKARPYLFTGWTWFLVTALPVIGLVQVGSQSMADRYTYLPYTGLFIVVVWGGADLLASWTWPTWAKAGVMSACAIALVAATWIQLGYWRDSVTLFERTIEVTEGNFLILNNYGAALLDAGRGREAVQPLVNAINLRPTHAEAFYNLGRAYQLAIGDRERARDSYARAVSLRPDYVDARINLGGVMTGLGDFREALAVLEPARSGEGKDRPELLFNLGVAYASLGMASEAHREVAALRVLDPSLAEKLAEFAEWKRSAPGGGNGR